ncbi:MAG TPA: hypothetical protein VGU23_04005 [Acidobacteriaceae bacterium]|nr:hypothetical protein [Acidobacteriaceae bacterium]
MNVQKIFPHFLALGLFVGGMSGSMRGESGGASDTPPPSAPAAAAAQPAAANSNAAPDAAAAGTSDAAPVSATVETGAPPPTVNELTESGKVAAKKTKGPYTGTWDVVVLPPAPMLDHEGKQRVDPEGNLMFNKPLQQIRDKKGHPVFDDNGKPVFQTATNLGYDISGKKLSAEKVKPPKMTPMSIVDGMLTVDGWTGKAKLNYDIADFKYLYLYTPGVGTTIVSLNPFPGATEIPGAFNDKSLKLTVDGHPIELTSTKALMAGKKPEAAWVVVDREYTLPVKSPVLGYGTTTKFPYAWPGSKESAVKSSPFAPPLPADVRPDLALAACPKGMMRPTGAGRLPGQKAVDEPCVPISSAGTASATAVTASN